MSFANRIKHILIAALAVLAMFASSASACTCSHNVEQTKEAPLCHSHSHEESSTPKNASLTSVDSPCECLLAKPAPAIIAKSEKKKLQLQKVIADPLIPAVEFKHPNLIAAFSAVVIETDPSTYLSRHLAGLLPSRAPPRL